jgi:hypothetical protein
MKGFIHKPKHKQWGSTHILDDREDCIKAVITEYIPLLVLALCDRINTCLRSLKVFYIN